MPYGEGRHLAPLVELVRTACGITDDDDPQAAERVRRTLARLDNPAPSLWVPGAVAERLLHLLGIERRRSTAVSPATAPRPIRTGATACSRRWQPAARARRRRATAGRPRRSAVGERASCWRPSVRSRAGCAARPAGPDRHASRRHPRAAPAPAHITLGPLDERTARRLLRAYLGGGELADPLRSACSAGPRATRTSSPSCCTCWSTAACCGRTATPGWRPARCRPTRCRPPCSPCSPPVSTGSTRSPSRCCAPRPSSGCASRPGGDRCRRRAPAAEVAGALDELTARQLLRPPRRRRRPVDRSPTRWRATSPTRACPRPSAPADTRAPRSGQRGARPEQQPGARRVHRRAGRARSAARRLDGAAAGRPGPRGAVRRIRGARAARAGWPARATSTAARPSCRSGAPSAG